MLAPAARLKKHLLLHNKYPNNLEKTVSEKPGLIYRATYLPTGSKRYYRAKTRSRARTAAAAQLLEVELADQEELLDLTRADVIDADAVPASDQPELPLESAVEYSPLESAKRDAEIAAAALAQQQLATVTNG